MIEKKFIEDMTRLNINEFKESGSLDSCDEASGSISIRYGHLDFGKWEFRIENISAHQKQLSISNFPGEDRKPFIVSKRIQLIGRIAPFNGIRWWFQCPLPKDTDKKTTRPCNRVCSFLYYDPENKIFGCRECLGLVYACSFEKKSPLIRKMMGLDRLMQLKSRFAKSRSPSRKKLLEKKIHEIDAVLQDAFNTDLLATRKKKLEVRQHE